MSTNISFYHVSTTKALTVVNPRVCNYDDVETDKPAVFLATSPYPHYTVTDVASPIWGGKIYKVLPRGKVYYGASYQEAYTFDPCDVIECVHINHRKELEILSDNLLEHIIDCDYDDRISELIEYYLDNPGLRLELNIQAESYVKPDFTSQVKWVCTQIYRL